MFFEQAMQLARRSLGLQYDVMGYGEEFKTFCEILFSYQYVKHEAEINDGITNWLYEHISGNISIVVSLIHDAQEIAILNGKEVLNLELLTEAYQKRLSMLHGFINAGQKKQSVTVKKKSIAIKRNMNSEITDGFCIADLVAKAKEDNLDIVQLLKEYISVEEVSI